MEDDYYAHDDEGPEDVKQDREDDFDEALQKETATAADFIVQHWEKGTYNRYILSTVFLRMSDNMFFSQIKSVKTRPAPAYY